MNNSDKWLAEVRRRIAAGLCRDCCEPVADGKRKCPACRAIEAEQTKIRRANKQASGVCIKTSCKKAAFSGSNMCAYHRAKELAYQKAYYLRCRRAER